MRRSRSRLRWRATRAVSQASILLAAVNESWRASTKIRDDPSGGSKPHTGVPVPRLHAPSESSVGTGHSAGWKPKMRLHGPRPMQRRKRPSHRDIPSQRGRRSAQRRYGRITVAATWLSRAIRCIKQGTAHLPWVSPEVTCIAVVSSSQGCQFCRENH